MVITHLYTDDQRKTKLGFDLPCSMQIGCETHKNTRANGFVLLSGYSKCNERHGPGEKVSPVVVSSTSKLLLIK